MSDIHISRESSYSFEAHSNVSLSLTSSPSNDSLVSIHLSDSTAPKKPDSAPRIEHPTIPPDSVPRLEQPEEINHYSLADYFKKINSASLKFRHQLSASDMIDQESRYLNSKMVIDQVLALNDIYQNRAQAIEHLNAEIREKLAELEDKLKKMETDTEQQRKLIDQINAGNLQEKQKHLELSQAHEKYLENLKEIGAVDLGNGNFAIPEEAQEQYNLFTKEYQQSVDLFNLYWKNRQTELNHYNSVTMSYNRRVSENNAFINDFIEKNHLTDFLKNNRLSIDLQNTANLRNISSNANQIEAPPLIYSTPAVIVVFPLSDYTYLIGKSGPQNLTPLQPYHPISSSILYDPIYKDLYDQRITPLDQNIQAKYIFWSFLKLKNLFKSIQDQIPDPILNSKKLASKILPEASLESTIHLSANSVGISGVLMQLIGLNHSALENVLGKILFKQAIQNFANDLFENQLIENKEQKIDQIVDQLMLLSVGLMSNQSLEALFPSLNPVSQMIDFLPPDHPSFALLFTISFANRVQEDIKHNINHSALNAFLEQSPELNSLSDKQKNQIISIINLGQILVATKLLETHLGLEGLLSAFLTNSSPTITSQKLIDQANQEKEQSTQQLSQKLYLHWMQNGYKNDEALFLAQTGSLLAQSHLSSPSVSSISSKQSVNQPLLLDAVKASLLLYHYPLEQADYLAKEAVKRTFTEAPFASTQQFRLNLAQHLKDLNLQEKSLEIANQAILISPSNSPLKNNNFMPESEIQEIVKKHVLKLLNSQLGTSLANQISAEVILTLFGSQNDQNSSYSLTNMMRDQLYHLHLNDNQERTNSLTQTFKESIKTMEDFYTFSLKLMDPAYLLIYSAQNGLMYGNQLNKKPLDILI